MEQLTLWSEEVLAPVSPSPASERGLQEQADSCGSTFDAFKRSCQISSSGKMSQGALPLSEDVLSPSFSIHWMSSGTVWHGEYWTRSLCEYPAGGGWIGPVAQRRRRVFLVGHLGDMRACEVLFEPESLRWDNPSSREKRKALARAAGRGTAPGGGEGGIEKSAGFCGYASHTAQSIGYEDEQSPTLKGNDWQSQVPDVVTQHNEECAHTVDTTGPEATAYAFKVRCGGGEYVKWDGSRGTAGRGALCDDQTAYTVAATQDQYLCVQEPMVMASAHTNAEIGEGGVAPSLIAHNQKQPPAVVMEVPSEH